MQPSRFGRDLNDPVSALFLFCSKYGADNHTGRGTLVLLDTNLTPFAVQMPNLWCQISLPFRNCRQCCSRYRIESNGTWHGHGFDLCCSSAYRILYEPEPLSELCRFTKTTLRRITPDLPTTKQYATHCTPCPFPHKLNRTNQRQFLELLLYTKLE